VKNYSGGTIEIWSQEPGDAPFGPTTPMGSIPAFNPAAVPGTFADGTMLLRGNFTTFTTLRFSGNTGSISSTIQWVAGSKINDLAALGIQNDWHWSGFFHVAAPVPPGYRYLYGGTLERGQPVNVEPTTWGRIKELWRGD
jgi:hypothetical protein